MLPLLTTKSFGSRLLLAVCLTAWGMPVYAQGGIAGANGTDQDRLDDILARLEKNVRDFRKSVPNFFCSEHAVSTMEPGPGFIFVLRETSESVFRVHRVIEANGMRLEESRTVRTVNGKPPANEASPLDSPMAVFGVFSTGLDMVSTVTKACFQFQLEPERAHHEHDPLVIDFQELPDGERDARCQYAKNITGKAYVDPVLMRVVRLESKTKDHEMQGGMKGTWSWRIDYAPVPLGEKTFWLPSRIRSTEVANREQDSNGSLQITGGRGGSGRGGSSASGGGHDPLTYGLDEKYSDYHLLHVTAKVMTETGKEIETAPEAVP